MEWFGDNPWLAWLGIALILAAVEAATVNFVFVMLAGGALVGGLAAAVGANFPVQVVAAVVVAALLLALVRPVIKRRFMDTVPDHGIGRASLVGREARVLQTVTETDGRVKLAGEIWSARIPEGEAVCEPGQEVRVMSIQGATVIVSGITVGRESE